VTDTKFYEDITTAVQKHLGEDWTAELLTNVTKNNGTNRVAIILYKNDDKIRPQIYLEKYYEDYQRGKELQEIVEEVLKVYKSAMKDINPKNLKHLEEWGNIKERLALRIVSKERNQEELYNLVYEEICDLVAIATICVERNGEGVKSIRITQDLARKWNVSNEEILEAAKENTSKLFSPKIQDLYEFVQDMVDISKEELSQGQKNFPDLQILTNDLCINGATVILYDSFMKDVYERLGGKFIILPSSIHEVLVVPLEDSMYIPYLQEVVESINQRFVAEDEILSDNVYMYDGEKIVLAFDKNGVWHYEKNND
jgi:hypothetical protein